MKKSVIVTIVAIIIIAGGVALAVSHHNKNNSSNMSSMNMSNSTSSSSSNNSTPQATNAVTIQNFAFSPANITVKAGTTVTWTNKDSIAHTVVETDSQTGPSSSDLANDANYSFTFKAAGTYHYHCSIHPNMVGTVTVTQ